MPNPVTLLDRGPGRTRRGAVALVMLAALVASVPSRADVEVAAQGDAASRPQLREVEGVKVVDIARPDAHGVSQNAFTRFDVGAAGVVLNNAALPAHSELLGAELGANAALNAAAARLILAEVVGDAASSLRGAIEVAGTRADLIIANPHGIECDGCSFIGSARTVLAAAGVLRDAQGRLSGLQTDGGLLRVGQRGLVAEQVDRLELLARRMRVGGGIRARELSATIGHLQQRYDGAPPQAFEVPGAAPQFALDVVQIGAMQAERIELRVTEKGAGVRCAGQLHATSGQLLLHANGRLELSGALRGWGSVDLRASSIDMVAPTLSSSAAMHIDAGTELHAAGANIEAHDGLDVKSEQTLVFERSSCKVDGHAQFVSNVLRNDASRMYGETLEIMTRDDIDNRNGGTLRGEHVELGTSCLSNIRSTIHGQTITTHIGTLDNRDGSIDSRSTLHLLGASMDNTRGCIDSLSDVLVRARGSLTNAHGTVHSAHGLELNVADRIDNTSGKISAGRRMRIDVGGSLRNDHGTIHGERGSMTLDTHEALVDNRNGTITHDRGDLRLNAQQLINAHGSIAAPTLALHSAEVDNIQGSLRGEERLDGKVKLLRNAHGTIHGKQLALYIDQLDNGKKGRFEGDVVELGGQVFGNLGGTLSGRERLELRAPQLDNRGGVVEAEGADGALRVRGDTVDNAGGTLRTAGDADIVLGATLHNRNGTVQARGVVLSAGQRFDNVGGSLLATGDARLDAARGIDNRGGKISAGAALRLDSHETALDNAAGHIDAKGPLQWDGGWIDNRGGSIDAARVELKGLGLRNSGDGRLIASDAIDATFDDVDNNGGLLQATGGALALHGAVFDNRGGRLLAGAGVNSDVRLMRGGVGAAAAQQLPDAAR